MTTDPIADMLTRIRNATGAAHPDVAMPTSKLREGIAEILKSEGFIDSYRVEGSGVHRKLVIRLKYGKDRTPVMQGLRRLSRPGHRVYKGVADLPRVRGGIGVTIVSTSEGLLTDREARRRKVGGELLCEVW